MPAVRTLKAPPGPRGIVKAAYTSLLFTHTLGFFMQLKRRYGDVVEIALGGKTLYIMSNPEHIEQIHARTGYEFIKGYTSSPSLARLLGNGLLTSEGDFWLRQRRLSAPTFHHKRIIDYASTIVDYAQRLAGEWQDGELRDIHEDMMRLTLEVVCKTLFGVDARTIQKQVAKNVSIVLGEFRRQVYLLLRIPGISSASRKRYGKAVDELDAVVYRIIEEHRQGDQDKGDLLSMLMAAQDEDGSRMTDKQLRDETMTLFLAGHETTANALTWGFYLLSSNPESKRAVVKEIDDVLCGRLPTFEDLARLPFTQAVVKETLRLYPPAWRVYREAAVDMEIGGFNVPRGTGLWMGQYLVHRDPRWFSEPDKFIPERWLSEEIKNLPKYAYFPFGGGPRICIGNAFAEMEANLVLATILQKYDVDCLAGQKIVPEPSMTLRPKYGIKVHIRKRA
jgi:cytochrome P450